MRKSLIGIGVLLCLGLYLHLNAPQQTYAQNSAGYPVQGPSPVNSEATSSTNASVTTTIAAAASGRQVIWGVTARCSAGSANITVSDGGTQIWSSSAAFVGTTTTSVGWTAGLAARGGNSLAVTLGACGSGNTGVLDVQASIF